MAVKVTTTVLHRCFVVHTLWLVLGHFLLVGQQYSRLHPWIILQLAAAWLMKPLESQSTVRHISRFIRFHLAGREENWPKLCGGASVPLCVPPPQGNL